MSNSLSANANGEYVEWVCAYFKEIIESKHLFFVNAGNQNLIKCKSIQCLLWACSLQTVKKTRTIKCCALQYQHLYFPSYPLDPLSLLKSFSFWTGVEEFVRIEKAAHLKATLHVR